MRPINHIILGFLFSLILFYLYPEITILGAIIIFLASVLIDVDHYLYYIYIMKDSNLANARKWFIDKQDKVFRLPRDERKKVNQIPCLLHGIETLSLLIILSLFFPIFLYILIGFIFHQFLDLLFALYYRLPLHHIGSQTYNIINHKIER